MIKQQGFIRDYVFPLAFVSTDGTPRFEEFVGTGFLIGNRGYALTAAHVLEAPTPSGTELVAMFVNTEGKWEFLRLLSAESHPNQDVGLIQLPRPNGTEASNWMSPFRLRNKWEGSSRRYDQWGYPSHALFDTSTPGPNDLPRPDLIYASGYIRRRVTQELGDDMRGNCFYEVSERAGSGCSGGPIYVNNSRIYDVLGVYVGEKRFSDGISFAYAANEQCFRDWSPPNLDVTILEESMKATP